ncbi:hypothetical protein GCM10009760_61380 [Kitasatospora kazusensis]|uniref:Uncharacterized protein n=1 Tax=Kitasatospora kazusensis TaxID=407974 RepID=A0ABP5M0W4_9ACTN
MTVEPSVERYTAEVTAGPGGVMTEEVGAVTGDLTVVTTSFPGGRAWVAAQYTGAGEWYTLGGCPVTVPDGQLEHYHQRVLATVKAGGEAGAPT